MGDLINLLVCVHRCNLCNFVSSPKRKRLCVHRCNLCNFVTMAEQRQCAVCCVAKTAEEYYKKEWKLAWYQEEGEGVCKKCKDEYLDNVGWVARVGWPLVGSNIANTLKYKGLHRK